MQEKFLSRPEYDEQVAVFEWAKSMEHKWPCLKLLFGSLMGANLPPKYLNKHKKAGMKKGKPDINLPVPMGGFCGLWIELKRIDGKPPKDGSDQDIMLKNLAIVGNSVHVALGSKPAIRKIKEYLEGKVVMKDKDKRAPFNPTAPLF